jgi:UDP-N-acetylmuramate dehydrogenase
MPEMNADLRWRYAELARDLGVEARENEPLASFTTMRVGGPATWLFCPETPEAAARLVAALREGPLPIRILGAGSNLVVVDEGVTAAVVTTRFLPRGATRIDERRVRASSGAPLPGLCRWAAEERLSGLEFGEGIPAQLGGAIRMNAGANGGWLSDVTRSVLVAGDDGGLLEFKPGTEDWGYRTSFVAREGLFVAEAILELVPDDEREIRERMKIFRERRRSTQPIKDRSAGCIFANYDDAKIGALVERLGLKGRRLGGAEVSSIHGNFIVNVNQASASDVLGLAEIVAEALELETGRPPRMEVEVWRDAS